MCFVEVLNGRWKMTGELGELNGNISTRDAGITELGYQVQTANEDKGKLIIQLLELELLTFKCLV